MQYTVVFDVLQSGYRNWWFAAMGIFFIVAGLGLVLFGWRFRRRRSRLVTFLFLILSMVWTWEVAVITWAQYRRLATALRDGTCEVVEGEVTQFHAMATSEVRKRVHDQESFTVGDHRFHYSDNTISAGFNQTAAHGSPIHDGLHVRIHCVGNDIAQLEIAK